MKPIPMLLAALLLTTPAVARVTSLRIDTVEPFADGQAFGATGAYERVSRWYARGVGGAAARQIKTHTNRR